jgi:hypothetical protein
LVGAAAAQPAADAPRGVRLAGPRHAVAARADRGSARPTESWPAASCRLRSSTTRRARGPTRLASRASGSTISGHRDAAWWHADKVVKAPSNSRGDAPIHRFVDEVQGLKLHQIAQFRALTAPAARQPPNPLGPSRQRAVPTRLCGFGGQRASMRAPCPCLAPPGAADTRWRTRLQTSLGSARPINGCEPSSSGPSRKTCARAAAASSATSNDLMNHSGRPAVAPAHPPGRAPHVDEIKPTLKAANGWQRIVLHFKRLDGALPARLTEPLAQRRKTSKPRPGWCRPITAGVPLGWGNRSRSSRRRCPPHRTCMNELAGRIADRRGRSDFSAPTPTRTWPCLPGSGAEPEADRVLSVGEQRTAIEVKCRKRVDDPAHAACVRSSKPRTAAPRPACS